MWVRDNELAITYTRHTLRMNYKDAPHRVQMVSQVRPLPADDRYYLFPRWRSQCLERAAVDGRECLRFLDNSGSAGLDLDANDPARDTLELSCELKLETARWQDLLCLGFLGSSAIRLLAGDGKLYVMLGDGKPVGCAKCNGWLQLELRHGAGRLMLSLQQREIFQREVPIGPRIVCFGRQRWPPHGNAPPKAERKGFALALASLKTRIVPSRPG
jgi:hypothetical protein